MNANMIGRENKELNDLFFVCSLIEYIARKTLNQRKDVINKIGKQKLEHIYSLADVYHCENLDKITDELIGQYTITPGQFDNVSACRYDIPTHWDIGKVYKRLVAGVSVREKQPYIDALFEVYNSWICKKIDDYNCSAYYENPEYLLESYFSGLMLP
jgi:hypothetical protein